MKFSRAFGLCCLLALSASVSCDDDSSSSLSLFPPPPPPPFGREKCFEIFDVIPWIGPPAIGGPPVAPGQFSINGTCYSCDSKKKLSFECDLVICFDIKKCGNQPMFLSSTDDATAWDNKYDDGMLAPFPLTLDGLAAWKVPIEIVKPIFICSKLPFGKFICFKIEIICHKKSSSSTGKHHSSSTGMAGDPELTGIQGQKFQVHGLPDTEFSLISWPSRQFSMSSLFVYLSTGIASPMVPSTHTPTAPWSHPGTYLGDFHFDLPGQHQLDVVCGPRMQGFASVNFDGQLLSPHDQAIVNKVKVTSLEETYSDTLSVQLRRFDELIISTGQLRVRIVNSDHFCNTDVALLDKRMLTVGASKNEKAMATLPHSDLRGLIGNTWKNVTYVHPVTQQDNMPYEGDLLDYQVHRTKTINMTKNKYINIKLN